MVLRRPQASLVFYISRLWIVDVLKPTSGPAKTKAPRTYTSHANVDTVCPLPVCAVQKATKAITFVRVALILLVTPRSIFQFGDLPSHSHRSHVAALYSSTLFATASASSFHLHSRLRCSPYRCTYIRLSPHACTLPVVSQRPKVSLKLPSLGKDDYQSSSPPRPSPPKSSPPASPAATPFCC